MTRTRRKLYMTVCRTRKVRNDRIEQVPSPFLAEIPPDLTSVLEDEEAVNPTESSDYFAMIKNRIQR